MAKLRVNMELVGDSNVPVTRTESIKHGSEMLNNVINSAVTALNSKAEKSYVDTELAKKANSSDLSGKADASTVSTLSSRVSQNETNIAAANTRIDNIVQTPSGSTEGNTELIDIRNGADGKNYTTAGQAVRSQITDLKSDLIQLETKGYPQASIAEAVNTWSNANLDKFVPYGSITEDKLSPEVRAKHDKGYVNPVEFGAKGDGVTVDNVALNNCFAYCAEHGLMCYGGNKTYLVDDSTDSITGHKGLLVTGGIEISDFKFKLKTGCEDMTTILSCEYNDNDYYIHNCDFIGNLRTIGAGAEDGGNHGIIFCNNDTLFPTNWQRTGNIKIDNCKFTNIQSYGIFPAPTYGKLLITNCAFSCHGPAILSYSVDCIIENCSYEKLVGDNLTVNALATDEIERFSNPSTSKKKNLTIRNCYSKEKIYQIAHKPQKGVVYGEILIEGCESRGNTVYAFDRDGGFSIIFDRLTIRNCICNMELGRQNAEGLYLYNLKNGLITIDNFKTTTNANPKVYVDCDITFKNTYLNFSTKFDNCSLNELIIEDCHFEELHSDFKSHGYFTTRYLTVGTCERVYIKNCISSARSRMLYGITAKNVFVTNLTSFDYIQLFYVESTQSNTDIYVSGLLMLAELPAYTFFIENCLGTIVITGAAKTLRFNGTSGSTLKNEVITL